ncbi:KEOPS complex subunit Pcc1 [Halopenitus salinus]|jgi:hypothetical protein|uniref:KEOPS complex subunit Pcc1 n=1 Tax=Halopenitus salinus TaxID=1198295 RepID=A0ABD5UVU3_9EURY
MSEPTDSHDTSDEPRRTATVRTRHDDPTVVDAAVAPDDTESMDGTVDGDATVVRRVDRETTGGLQSTVDDYLRNLHVADRVAERGRSHASASDGTDGGRNADGGGADAVANRHADEHDTTPTHDT